ncbi:MAG: hexitol phosphatase HxpB [Bacteroidales bacterium]|nr:hexitol phosphatase HxpB [Bacteroidales bacterium]
MIKAVIFDFDGIIIDSEPLWVEAEIEVFKTVGVELKPELCRQTTGLNTQDTIQYWHNVHKWTGKSTFQLYKEIMEAMQSLIFERADLKDGFLDVLQLFVDKKIPVGVASSSPLKLITTALKKFHLFEFFKIISSSENEEFGKPHPALYLGATRKLGIDPVNCLAFEDSLNGAISAKAARMKLVTVPDSHDYASTRFDFSDLKLASLTQFKEKDFEYLNALN